MLKTNPIQNFGCVVERKRGVLSSSPSIESLCENAGKSSDESTERETFDDDETIFYTFTTPSIEGVHPFLSLQKAYSWRGVPAETGPSFQVSKSPLLRL